MKTVVLSDEAFAFLDDRLPEKYSQAELDDWLESPYEDDREVGQSMVEDNLMIDKIIEVFRIVSRQPSDEVVADV